MSTFSKKTSHARPKKFSNEILVFHFLSPPDLRAISPRSVACNPLAATDVAHAPPFATVAGAIRAVLDGRIWAGHNVAAFDLRVLREHFAAIEEKMPQAAGVVDTLPLLRAHFGKSAWCGRHLQAVSSRVPLLSSRVHVSPPPPSIRIVGRADGLSMMALGLYFEYGEEEHRAFANNRMIHAVLRNAAAVLWLEEHCAEEMKRPSGHAESAPAAGGVAAAVASEQWKACGAGPSPTTARRRAGREDETLKAGASVTTQ